MSSKTFSKDFRLLSKADFAHLKSGSSKIKAKYLMAFYKEGRLLSSNTRLGISVSKKVGNAVKRNKVKRHIREMFRTSDLKSTGKDLLIVAHPRLYQDKFESPVNKINDSLKVIFKNLGS